MSFKRPLRTALRINVINMKNLMMLLVGVVFFASAFITRETIPVSKDSVVLLDTLKKDPETGLALDDNMFLVKAQCTVCHSAKLVTANRFTREGWLQKIRWMQKNHNLWELGEIEKPILDYLEKYYAPTQNYARRQPLKDIKWYKLEEKK